MTDNYSDLSQLEREFELEMEGSSEPDVSMEFEGPGDESEYRFELEQDDELADEFESEFEQADSDYEYGDPRSDEFVDRLLEIGGRQFESPYEADAAMNEVLGDIEREYFFGALKRGLRRLSKNKLLRSLARKGMTFGVNKFFPGLQGALQLARGNVRGALLNFGKQALGTVVPGGGPLLDAVSSIGLGAAGGGGETERETWENYVNLSREAYEHLAENLTPTAHQPAEAMRLANNAVQHAIARARGRADGGRRAGGRPRGGRVVRLRVSPGERIKLVVVGA
jgi:hypothetical protein